MNFLRKGLELLSFSAPTQEENESDDSDEENNEQIRGSFYIFIKDWNCKLLDCICQVRLEEGKFKMSFTRVLDEGEEEDDDDVNVYEFVMGGGMEYEEGKGPLNRKSFQFIANGAKTTTKFLFEINNDKNFHKVQKISKIFATCAASPLKPKTPSNISSPSPSLNSNNNNNNNNNVNLTPMKGNSPNTPNNVNNSDLDFHTPESSPSPLYPKSNNIINNNNINNNINNNNLNNNNYDNIINNIINNGKEEIVIIKQEEIKKESLGKMIFKEQVKVHIFNEKTTSYSEFGEVFISLFDASNNPKDPEKKYSISLLSLDEKKVYFTKIVNEESFFWFLFDRREVKWCSNVSEFCVWSCLIAFKGEIKLFAELVTICQWESSSHLSFNDLKQDEKEFVLRVCQPQKNSRNNNDDDDEDDGEMLVSDSEEEEDDLNEGDEQEDENDLYNSDDTDEENDNEPDHYQNSELAVGSVKRISVVARGPQLGIFKEKNGKLVYSTKVNTNFNKKGRKLTFNPQKMLLHGKDENLLFLDKDKPNSIIKMDLNRGEVIDEWTVGSTVKKILSKTKNSNNEGSPVIYGMNNNGVFSVDMRERFKENQVNQSGIRYGRSNNPLFTCAATTEEGHIALGMESGQVRLFSAQQLANTNLDDKIRTKNNIQLGGSEVIGIDVTSDGEWLLVTCKRYLFVVPTKSKDETVSGFEKQINYAKRKDAIRLDLTPDHLHAMGGIVSFTEAHFNQNERGESSIVTSTGPYIITWNFDKIKSTGKVPEYQIKKYKDTVVADQFKFGEDNAVIVALPQDVTVTRRIAKKN